MGLMEGQEMKQVIVETIETETCKLPFSCIDEVLKPPHVLIAKFRTHAKEFKLHEEVGVTGLDGSKHGVFRVSGIITIGKPLPRGQFDFYDEVIAKRPIQDERPINET